MAIYTKSGDTGETGLVGGMRVPKNTLRIEAIGEVDELNAYMGLLRVSTKDQKIDQLLSRVQNELFILGADLAALEDKPGRTSPRILATHTSVLERDIDAMEKKLPPLHHFVLPGGTPFAAYLHLARNVCRRAERRIVSLAHGEKINPHVIPYINRLSDLLFILARYEMFRKRKRERIWKWSWPKK